MPLCYACSPSMRTLMWKIEVLGCTQLWLEDIIKFIKLIMFVHTTQRTAVLIKEKHQAFFKACMD